jgi:hypothetical protein
VYVADGTARVPVIRRLKVLKPSAPPAWHSTIGSAAVHRSTTLPALLAPFQVGFSNEAEPKSARTRPGAFVADAFVDPLDDNVDLFAVPTAPPARPLTASQLAHFLLRRVDDQLLSDTAKPQFPAAKLPHAFALLRRMIAHSFAVYSALEEPHDIGQSALQLYSLIVALRALRCVVLQLPAGRDAALSGFHAGAVDGSPSTSAQARFVDLLNSLLTVSATSSVSCLAAPAVTEVITDTLSRGKPASR